MRLKCPHCGSNATIRTSRKLSEVSTELYCHCTNVEECAFSWVEISSASHALSIPINPNPKVHVPLSTKLVAAMKHIDPRHLVPSGSSG